MTENDIITQAADLIGGHVAVTYGEGHPAVGWQVDGALLGITPDGVEGQYLILFEQDPTDDEYQFRAIPVSWVIGISEGASE